MNVYKNISVEGYQRVLEVINNNVGLHAIISVHNTNLGTALGGCRLMKYDSRDSMLTDALRLSKGMTYKNALAGLTLGGGKSVINSAQPTIEILQAFGEAMNYINKDSEIYYTAGDIGMGSIETKMLNKYTKYVNRTDGKDSGYATAYGVFQGIKAGLKVQGRQLDKSNILITGNGKVGRRLAKFLAPYAKGIVILDLDRIDQLPRMLSSYADVYAPCAIGGVINPETVKYMKDGLIISGGANNQISDEEIVNPLLKEKGIIYCPDYLVNSGGVIIVSENITEDLEYDDPKVLPKLNYITQVTEDILLKAKRDDKYTSDVADEIAESIWKK